MNEDKFRKRGIIRSYSVGSYNKHNKEEQWIRMSNGCPNKCPFCYEPPDEVTYDIPKIVRNKVKVMDMNLLSKISAQAIIDRLGKIKVNGRKVYYELVCGIDYRFLTSILAKSLKQSGFVKPRLAWDFFYKDQFKIRDAIKMLLKAGYKERDITIFMICNWRIPYEECKKKLYLCAVWNVKVADCYFDGQLSPNIEPIGWTAEQIKDFRRSARKHNQLVNFKIDPQIK